MNANNKKTELTIPVEKEFYDQECQDAEITKKFKELHVKIVNEVILFCKDNGIIVDEFYLHADGLDESIKFGSWQPATDSQFELVRDTEGNEDKETFLFSKGDNCPKYVPSSTYINLIGQSKLPKGDDIAIACFNVVFDNIAFGRILYLLLLFPLSTHLKCLPVYFEIAYP